MEDLMRMIGYKQLKLKMGEDFYSRDHLRRKCKSGEFPKPIRISDRRIAWIEQEIDDWLQQRASLRDVAATDSNP
jgi:prophage regulatory protein